MASVCGRSKGRGAPPRACYDARGHGRDEFARQLRASAPPCGPRGPPWQIATLLNTGVPLTSRALGNPGLLRRAGRALVHPPARHPAERRARVRRGSRRARRGFPREPCSARLLDPSSSFLVFSSLPPPSPSPHSPFRPPPPPLLLP